jgi:carbon monoxide dehydrogenase subunit G
MIVRGTFSFPGPPASVATVLRDPRRLVDALPNVDAWAWDDHEDGIFTARIRPALALGEVPMHTRWTPLPMDGLGARYRVDGRTDEHRLALDVELRLRPEGTGAAAEWTVDCRVTGTLRSAGQRVLQAVVAAQARMVLAAIGRLAP